MKPPKFYRKFNYDKSLIPNKYLASMEQGVSTIEEAKAKTGLSIGYPGWCLIYYSLLSHLNPEGNNLIVETGTNQGWTTIILAQALRDSNGSGKIYTVELDQENYKIALANFQQAGVADLIKAINGDSKIALKEIVNKHDSIRVAFLDASHLFDDVIAEFEIILPALGPQSLVVFDNTYSIAEEREDQRVNGALKEILKRHGGNLVNLEFVSWYTPGVAIWQKSPFDSLKTIEANNKSKHTSNVTTPQSDSKQSQNDMMRHSQEELKLWEISQKLFSMVEYSDFKRALECIALIEKQIIGRHCGDLGDKLAQYLAIIQFFRESGVESADSIEIGTLFGGSCLLKLMAMRDLNVGGKIICIDPMEGYYGNKVDPYSGLEVKTDILFNNLDIFGFSKEAIELKRIPSNENQATAGLIEGAYATLMIDGDHSYQGVRYDWDQYNNFVSKGGFILLDDYAEPAWPDITKFVKELIGTLPRDWDVIGQIGTTFLLKKNTNSIDVDLLTNHRRTFLPGKAIAASNALLAQYKDKHRGQRCVIIGNGPSLNRMDLSFLKEEITFGLNRIYLLFDKWDFTPTYYVSVNPLVIEQSVDDLLKIPSPKFLSLNGLPYVADHSDIIFLKSIYKWFFSTDPRNGICEGYTVTYVAMQLAYFMGFSEVILIGVDHHFTTSGQPNQEVVSNGDDPNHFHPGYFGKGIRWNLPDLKNSEVAYNLAKSTFEADGRRIVDATLDGKLRIFPKANYQELFEKYRKIDQLQKGHLSEPTFLNQQGEDLFNKGDTEGALNAFTKAIEISPNFATAHNNLGVLYWQAGEVQKAVEHFVKALEIDPNDRDTILNCGEFFKSLGKLEDAKNIYSSYLRKNPDDQEVVQALANLEDNEDSNKDRGVVEIVQGGNSKHLVSAIVSTYNSERFIRGCLEDLEAQTIADKLEIIVVNSGSLQNEETIVKEFQQKYSNIKYIKTEQRETIYAAWNRGIRAAAGKYITNANTDDRHRKDAFELLAKILDENPDVALVYADQIITEKENETLEKHTPAGVFFWPDFDRNYLLKVCSTGSQPMWRKSVHEEFGYFDESMHIAGDYEFWLRVTQKYPLKHVPELLGLYYRSSQNAEYRNHWRTMQETALIQSCYKTKHMLNEPQVQGNPLVSVILPTYNRPQQLETALKSIALQSYKNIEAVVVNDGGEDVSAVIGKFKGQLEIQYINHKQNKDRAAARNTGLKNARGEYIAYLDDDDIFHTDHIDTALRVLTNSDYKIVYSDAFRAHQKKIDGNYQIVRKDIPYSIDYQPGMFLKTNITPTPCIIHEKSVIDEVGYFDELLPVLEDWDLWIRISQKYEFYHIKKVTCEFAWRDDGSTTTSAKIDQFAKYRQIIAERYLKKAPPQKEKDQRPLVSIIMLTFNALQYTKKCIDSIFEHTREPFELIVVDNGSTDGTVGYLESEVRGQKSEGRGQKSPRLNTLKGPGSTGQGGRRSEVRIKIIKNSENLGFAVGNNQGMAAAEGDYILLMNNDLVVTPGWLGRLIACAERKPQIGIVGPMSNYVSGPQLVKAVSYDTSSLVRLNKFSRAFARKHAGQAMPFWRVVGFCMLIKRAVIEKIGGLDGRYGLGNFEDDDFSLRATLAGFESCIASDCFIHHFGNRTFVGARIDYRESLNKNWEIYKKKWGIPADVAYGASYDMASVVKDGFIPAKHYCPLTSEEYFMADGEQLFSMGDIEGALSAFTKAIEINPNFTTAYNNLGVLYWKTGEVQKAVEHFIKALEIDPNDRDTILNYGELFKSLGKIEDAKNIYSSYVQRDPNDEEIAKALDELQDKRIVEVKDEKYLVSAIVSTYNSERFIRGCLEDLEAQTIADKLEIVVVDSGSEQNERAIVEEFQKKHSNIKYIKTEQRETVYAAWNRGIKAASGKYITNANTDDRHRVDAYERMVEVLDARPDIALVYADVIVTLQENETFDKCTSTGYYRWLEWNRRYLLDWGCFMGPQPMWKRSLHDEYGYFDDSFVTSGDYEFWLRISQTNNVLHISAFLGLYLNSPRGLEKSNRERQMVENTKILSMYREAATSGEIIRRFYSDDKKDLIRIHNRKGEELFSAGNIKGAKSIFEQIAARDPRLTEPLNNLGVIAFQQGEIDEAISYFTRVLEIDENYFEAMENLGKCMEAKQEHAEGVKWFKRALGLRPDDISLLNSLGNCFIQTEDFVTAREVYEKSLQLDSSQESIEMILREMGRLEEAKKVGT